MNNNGQNGYLGYNGYLQHPSFYAQQQTSMPVTNKLFVTGLDDALNRPAERNSVMIYLHQDKPLLFEIATDMYGKKSVTTYEIAVKKASPEPSQIDLSGYVTRDEFNSLRDQISSITAMFKKSNDQGDQNLN